MEDNIDRVRAAHSYLKVIHEAANNANDKLVIENNKLRDRNKFLTDQLVGVEKTMEIQKTVVRNNIAESQEKHERDYQEIEELRATIKELTEELKELKCE